MMSLTPREAELLFFLRERIEAHGVAPSFDEMRVHLGLSAKSGVHRLLSGLEERGRIRRLPNRARAIEVIPEHPLASFTTEQLRAEIARRESIQ